MRRTSAMIGLAALLAVAGGTARAADHLDCMDGRYGDAEQALIARRITTPGKSAEGVDAAVQSILAARAGACAYLYGWSERARHAAVLRAQWSMIREVVLHYGKLTEAERARIMAAIEPKRAAFLALFAPSVAALEAGADAPPPPIDMFHDFRFVLRQAGLADTPAVRNDVEGWLYVQGMMDALAAAFASA